MSKSGSVAVITGTSSGIGAAIANALLREEWTVLGLSRRRADFDHPCYRHIQADLGELHRLADLAGRELAPVLTNHSWQRIAPPDVPGTGCSWTFMPEVCFNLPKRPRRKWCVF